MASLSRGAEAGRFRRIPAGRTLYAARAGFARRVSAALREAQCRGRDRRRAQQRHTRNGCRPRSQVQLFTGAATDIGQGEEDRGGVQQIQGAAAGGGTAIPACPSRHRLACAGNAHRRADGAEHRLDQPPDPQGILAGSETRRAAARGCADAWSEMTFR